MADELLVAGVVRTLAEHERPQDAIVVDQAVSRAVKAYLSGASVPEACEVGLGFLARSDPGDVAPGAVDHAAGPLVGQVA